MAVVAALTTAAADSGRLLAVPPCPGLLDPIGVGRVVGAGHELTEQQVEHAFCLLSLRRMHTLERLCFPRCRSRLLEASGNAFDAQIVMQHAATLFERIAADCFPVSAHVAWDWECAVGVELPWFLQWIPLEPVAADYLHPSEVVGNGIFGRCGVIDLLMGLATPEVMDWDEGFVRDVSDRMHQCYDVQRLPPGFRLSQVAATLEQYPPAAPFDDVAAVCRFVLQESGNFWLDVGYHEYVENSGGEAWLHEGLVEVLREQWVEAQPVLDARIRLERYIDANDGREPLRRERLVNLLLNTWQMSHNQLVLPLRWNTDEQPATTPYPD